MIYYYSIKCLICVICFVMRMKLIHEIARRGLRIFTIAQAKEVAKTIGMRQTYVPHVLYRLVHEGLVNALMRGTYALPNELLAGPPMHPYEIAMALIQPAAISCWSAMSYHQLSDQFPHALHMLTPRIQGTKHTSQYCFHIEGHEYHLIRVEPENYWGIDRKYFNGIGFNVTDLERTLLDGLMRPKYCGGILEVISAFEIAASRINVERILTYSVNCSSSVKQRLGWVCETLNILPDVCQRLREEPFQRYIALSPDKAPKGKYHRIWKVVENI